VKNKKATGSAAILSILLTAPSLASDRFPLYWIGPQGEAFSAAAGDVNGDGMADIVLVSTGQASPSFPEHAIVRSGLDGSAVHAWTPSLSNFWAIGGSREPAGDLDLDGFDDVALSIVDPNAVPVAQVVEVRSGQDASVMAILSPSPVSNAFVLGISIAGVGDLDGDGSPELLISGNHQVLVPGCLSWGQGVYNFEAPGFAVQYFNTSWQCSQNFGSQIGRLDDVDGDGFADFYVGAPRTYVGGMLEAGWVGLFSGTTGSLITSLNGSTPIEYLGSGVAGLSDVTGDGNPELAVIRGGGFNDVAVLSLPAFSTLYTLPASSIGGPGGVIRDIDTLHDADGDGMDDFLVLWRNSQLSEGLTAFSGPSGAPLGQVTQGFSGGALYWFAGLGDANGDGLGDFATTPWAIWNLLPPLATQSLWSPWTWPMTTGQATVHVARNFDLVGTATVGGSALFGVVAPRRAGKPFHIVFSQDFVFPGVSLGPFLFPLVMDGLFWASLSAGIGGTLDATGHATLTLPIPNNPALHGAVFQASGVVYDPAGPLGIGCVLTQLPVPIQ
jgi:hypothetical protein